MLAKAVLVINFKSVYYIKDAFFLQLWNHCPWSCKITVLLQKSVSICCFVQNQKIL